MRRGVQGGLEGKTCLGEGRPQMFQPVQSGKTFAGGQAAAVPYGVETTLVITAHVSLFSRARGGHDAFSIASTIWFICSSLIAPSHRRKTRPSAPKNTVVGRALTE